MPKERTLEELYEDTLEGALGGFGISYWAEVAAEQGDDLIIVEFETDKEYVLNLDTIRRGFQACETGNSKTLDLHSSYIGRFLAAVRDPEQADLDGPDSDIIVQLGIFGKVIYG